MRRFVSLTTRDSWGKSRIEYLVPVSEIKLIRNNDGCADVSLKSGEVIEAREKFNDMMVYLNEP